MDDYSIKVKNLPFDAEFDNKELILKAMLWEHFTNLVGNHHLPEDADHLNVDDKANP